MTTRILFLLSPMFFGGLYLLLGETLNWIKKKKHEHGWTLTAVELKTGRE